LETELEKKIKGVTGKATTKVTATAKKATATAKKGLR
jgi:hypothetical protein